MEDRITRPVIWEEHEWVGAPWHPSPHKAVSLSLLGAMTRWSWLEARALANVSVI